MREVVERPTAISPQFFHAAAEAGSFTHAADKLHLSQSAISRQVSSLEQDVGIKLFHRHARGLILTEQGEILYRTAHEVLMKLESVKVQLSETTDKPSGKLRITTTVGLGQGWLTDKIQEFMSLHPDVQVQLILDNEELDVNMLSCSLARLARRLSVALAAAVLAAVALVGSAVTTAAAGLGSSPGATGPHGGVLLTNHNETLARDTGWAKEG